MSASGFFDPYFVERYLGEDALRETDIAFYAKLASQTGGKILEAGCGDGRLLIPLTNLGSAISGFDSSPLMIAALRTRDSKADVWVGSLTDSAAFRGSSSLVICAFNTFLHLLTQAEQLIALQNFSNALERGGTLVIDVINPYFFDIFESGNRQFDATYVTEGGMINVYREFDSALIEQRATFRKIYDHEAGGKQTTEVEFRWVYMAEMQLLLERAGFSDVSVTGGFEGEPLTDDSAVMVWLAKKD